MSLYDSAVPAYLQILNSIAAILKKAEDHVEARKIDPNALLGARLFPDMLPLMRQVQLVTDFAAKGCARLTGSEIPVNPDVETSFAELQTRLARTIDYVKGFTPAQFEGAEAREISFPAGPSKTITLNGQQFLSNFSLPNFYFHAATTHGLLRHNGIDIGKADFMGV